MAKMAVYIVEKESVISLSKKECIVIVTDESFLFFHKTSTQ